MVFVTDELLLIICSTKDTFIIFYETITRLVKVYTVTYHM